MSTAFDITSFETAETTFVHLKSPVDDEPIYDQAKNPVGITFHTPGSEAYETAAKKRTNRGLARSKRKIDLTADILRADALDFLTEVTIEFNSLGYPPAGAVTGKDLFRALYEDRKYGWVVEQANTHLNDWASFTKGSVTS